MPHLHLMPLLGVPVEILIKIAIFHAAPAFDAPVRGPHRNTDQNSYFSCRTCILAPVRGPHRNTALYGKTRMVWLPNGKKMENVFTRFYYYYYYYYYYYKCHGLQCCHHTVVGALYKIQI